MKKLNFNLLHADGSVQELQILVDKLCIIGYAGRDMEKTMEHVRELEEIGCAPPKSIPAFFPVSTDLLSQDGEITVVGKQNSGEVEFAILRYEGELYVGISSDHTDRALEAIHMHKSKQICAKPLGNTLWKFSEVKDHWDELEMTSWQIVDGKEVLYQQGTAAEILPLEKLVQACDENYTKEDCIMYSGTIPTIGGFQYGELFKGCIEDKKLNRKMTLVYSINRCNTEE